MSKPPKPQPRARSLQEIQMIAAQRAARNESMLPLDRLRPERGQVLNQPEAGAASPALTAVDRAVANMMTADPEKPSDVKAEADPDAPPLPQFTAVLPSVPQNTEPPDLPMATTPFVDELAHAVIQLSLWERKINQSILIGYPDGRREKLGELLMRLGDYLQREEEKKIAPRILLPGAAGYDA
jgi:hypothetical protein